MDQDIISAARLGDKSGWRKLYADLAPAVRGYYRSRRVSDPEDLVGSVFLDLARGIGNFQGDYRQFRAWGFTIAHRRWVDDVRAAQRHPTSPLESVTEEPSSCDVEDDALSRVVQESLLRYVDALPTAQRSVVLLRVLGDLSHEEIAEVLGKSAMAVRVNYHRGMKALRGALDLPHPLESGSPVQVAAQPDVTL